MSTISRYVLILICVTYIKADAIDRGMRSGVMLKFLREMVNQTKADMLNLPANATSIRENITDNFSCENRTYGYYADVENECQVFHVCLTSEGATGRNTTYRWSFICPKETIFNQEVMTCTRPRDSINCEDSPMYYDVNMDIGKVPNDTNADATPNKDKSKIDRNKEQRKKINRRKQSITVQNIYKDVNDGMSKENLQMDDNEGIMNIDSYVADPEELLVEEVKPVIHEVGEEYEMNDAMEDTRLVMERNMRRGRKGRGAFRFKKYV